MVAERVHFWCGDKRVPYLPRQQAMASVSPRLVADSFHRLQSGKGNKTPDWIACGASKSLSCRPWDAASSLALNGGVPNEGLLSGSRRCTFLLKANERFFHTWRIASLTEVGLLVFDRPFDFFNLPPASVASSPFTSRR